MIRKFDNSAYDYAGVVAAYNAEWPDEPTTVENWKFYNSVQTNEFLNQYFVVESVIGEDGEQVIIASCSARESASSHIPGKYQVGFSIHPDYANQGIEEQIYQYLLDFLSEQTLAPKFLVTMVREDRTDRVNFWTSHGFEIMMRAPQSELVVTDYDFSYFDETLGRVANQGINLFTMTELQQRDPDWLRHYYELFWLIVNDVPSADKRTPLPFENWRKRIIDGPDLLPDANFFALDGNHWVGVSNLRRDLGNAENLNVGVTGILPSHRRKGIATALKLKTIQYAVAHNVVTIRTGNEENNPMYNLNLALGFKSKPAWLSLRKTL
jgi:mycothiol synthase